MSLVGGLSPVLGQFLLMNLHLPYGIAYLLIAGSLAGLWGLRLGMFTLPLHDRSSSTI